MVQPTKLRCHKCWAFELADTDTPEYKVCLFCSELVPSDGSTQEEDTSDSAVYALCKRCNQHGYVHDYAGNGEEMCATCYRELAAPTADTLTGDAVLNEGDKPIKCPDCAEISMVVRGDIYLCLSCGVTHPFKTEMLECPGCKNKSLDQLGQDKSGQWDKYKCNDNECRYVTYVKAGEKPKEHEKVTNSYKPEQSIAAAVSATPAPAQPYRCQMIVLDDAVVAYDAPETTTCNRAPSNNSPHRHFSVIQLELDEWNRITNCAVTPGMHAKEVKEVIESMAAKGIAVFCDDKTDERVTEKSVKAKIVVHQMGLQQSNIWVDMTEDSGKQLKYIGHWDAGKVGYEQARRAALTAAARYNIPIDDKLEAKAIG